MTAPRLIARNLTVARCRSRTRSAWYAMRDTLRQSQTRALRGREFAALDNVSLELRAGEAVAVLGANGAGKSSLLKTLAGMLDPVRGSVEAWGRVAAVIELGAGLNPLLTGRENVVLAALLRGVARADHAAYLADVEEFADLGAGFDAPTGSYSSGMRARLAFALAAMTRPDILLVDEALSVGDIRFQRKCVQHIQAFLEGGGALVLATHNLVQAQSLCAQAILLEAGRPRFAGSTTEAVRLMVQRDAPAPAVLDAIGGPLRLVRFGGEHGDARTGAPAELIAEYSLGQAFDDVMWGFELWTADQQLCITTAQDMTPRMLAAEGGTLRCRISHLPIAPGTYALRLNIVDRISGTPVALLGFGGPAPQVTIENPPSIASNYQVEAGQIAVIEVSWT